MFSCHFSLIESSYSRFINFLKNLLSSSMFGGHVTVPANSPHLRKSGSRPVVSDLGRRSLTSKHMQFLGCV